MTSRGAWSAQLTECDAKTVARYVPARDSGGDLLSKMSRPRLIGEFMPKVEELVDRSKGKIRATETCDGDAGFRMQILRFCAQRDHFGY